MSDNPEADRASSNTDPQPRGWGWPEQSRKAHYFIGTMSLCNKWGFFFGDLFPRINPIGDKVR